MSDARIFPPGRVAIVGVLNVTPDSFSDGVHFVDSREELDLEAALAAGRSLWEAGADLLDVGGESTRPGARAVPPPVEIARTRPLVEALAKQLACPISIDTRCAAVAEAALSAGASVVNDVSGLRSDPSLAAVVSQAGAGLILGHMRGVPATMQQQVAFHDVLEDVTRELARSVDTARAAGVPASRLAVDPGIGFGKELEHNLSLLANLDRLRGQLGLPVLVGPSRKSFLGALTGRPPAERDLASHAACAVAVFAGADAVRVHDVAGARQAVAVAEALRRARREAP